MQVKTRIFNFVVLNYLNLLDIQEKWIVRRRGKRKGTRSNVLGVPTTIHEANTFTITHNLKNDSKYLE
jgi:hypothetical protein